MRKLMVLPMAGLLVLAVAAPVAAGPNVHNTSGGGRSVHGEWYGEGLYGGVLLWQENGHAGEGEVFQESGTYVLCEGGAQAGPETDGTIGPLDTGPGDEFYGFQGTRTWGWAHDVTIDFSRRLERGTATGSVELSTETIDECAGVYGGEPTFEHAELTVSLTGEGSLATFRGHGSYQLPSVFNGHENYRGKERAASGSVVAGTAIDAQLDFGHMVEVTWTQHSNS